MSTFHGFEQLLERVRAYTDDVLIPREAEMVASGSVPRDVLAGLAGLGLFGMSIPRQHGGLGLTMEEQVLLTFEFTRASCVYRSTFSTTVGLASQVLLAEGTDEQRRAWLPRLATGETRAAFALTEESAGSDASAITTEAVVEGKGFRINGAKRYITNGLDADILVVFARLDGHGPTAFLVERGVDGLTGRPAGLMNGHEANPVTYLDLTDVHVGRDAMVGTPGQGLRLALRGINHARTHVAATAVGQGTRILAEAAHHAASRRQFGGALADLGSVQAKLGESFAKLTAARALTLACAQAWDAGSTDRHQIAAAKYFATETVGLIADHAVQVLGGAGIVGEHPVPRMWRDVRALRIYEGASEVHERNLARHVVSSAADGRGTYLLATT